MKRGLIIIPVIAGTVFFAPTAQASAFRLIFEQNPATRWDRALAGYERQLESEIEILKMREQAVAPGSEPLRAALSGGSEAITTEGLPVRQTGTVGDTALRLAKEFTLRVVWLGRWILHNIFAFYGLLILIVLVLFRSIIGLIAIFTPKKRIF